MLADYVRSGRPSIICSGYEADRSVGVQETASEINTNREKERSCV
jgi:hypothetical protein